MFAQAGLATGDEVAEGSDEEAAEGGTLLGEATDAR